MLFYLAGLATCWVVIVLLAFPSIGVLLALMARPIVDATWNHPIVGNLRWTEVISVAIPVEILIFMALRAKSSQSIKRLPLLNIWYLNLSATFISFCLISIEQGPIAAFSVFFRQINGFVGYYMGQAFFLQDKGLGKFLLALLMAGLFPLAVGLYQWVTGTQWIQAEAEGLTRYVGLYHDAFTIRYYMEQLILAAVLYSAIFGHRRVFLNLALAILGICALVVMFRAYSKSGMLTLAAWGSVWAILGRRFIFLGVVAAIFLAIGIYYLPEILGQLQQLFHKEIGAIEGNTEVERTLAGRWYGWKEVWESWKEIGIFGKSFGSGLVATGVHNDYLMLLLHGGLFAVASYLALLFTVGYKLIGYARKTRTPLALGGVMAFCMWMIDSIGLVPSAYPGYQWFIWGIIGICLRRGQEESKREKVEKAAVREQPLVDLKGAT
jgi:O-antigen ligase